MEHEHRAAYVNGDLGARDNIQLSCQTSLGEALPNLIQCAQVWQSGVPQKTSYRSAKLQRAEAFFACHPRGVLKRAPSRLKPCLLPHHVFPYRVS